MGLQKKWSKQCTPDLLLTLREDIFYAPPGLEEVKKLHVGHSLDFTSGLDRTTYWTDLLSGALFDQPK